MLPDGLLMKEYKLIEQMITLIKKIKNIKKEKPQKSKFIDTAVDFIKMYADSYNHAKKEDILFRDLDKKHISTEYKSIVKELIQEQIWEPKTVAQLIDAKNRYVQGDKNAHNQIIEPMEKLIKFYPLHIEKEYKRFFMLE